jgi:Flp pilus assembly protein TadD
MAVTTLGPTQERELAIGVTRLREHMVNHAELIFRRILAVAPGHADTQRFLGIALYKLGRRHEGVALLRAVADLQPEGSEAWADLAAALQGVGDVSAAQEAYGRATRGLATARRTHPNPSG